MLLMYKRMKIKKIEKRCLINKEKRLCNSRNNNLKQ